MFEKHLWKSDILSKEAGHWSSVIHGIFLSHIPEVYLEPSQTSMM